MEVPSAYVEFLRAIAAGQDGRPSSTRWSGCRSTARRSSIRDFLHHLKHSTRPLHHRAGHQGPRDDGVHAAVVSVRVQGDQGPHRARRRTPTARRSSRSTRSSSTTTAPGRMTDILEYSDVAFPRDRFAPELLAELARRRAVAGRARGRPRRRPAPLHRAADDAAQPLPRAAPTTRSAMHAMRDYGDAHPRARRGQHLRRRPAVQELRRHALRPRRVLRLRRDRVPDRLQFPDDPAAAARLGRDVGRRLVPGRARTTSSPRSSRPSC